jgi:hypothetical protein
MLRPHERGKQSFGEALHHSFPCRWFRLPVR